jgi:pseudaminic acid cytidylyltransferase
MDIAIIPAKSYSSRLPNKNVKNLFGKPIIYYAINKALKSKCFKKVFVSTDSEKIRNLSIKLGADKHELRSSKFAKDETTLLDLFSYESKRIKKIYPSVKNICCILPTALFFTSKQIKESKIKLMNDKKLKFSFICSEINSSLAKNFFILKNIVKISNDIFLKKNSQYFPQFYVDGGQFYYGRVDCWINKKDIFNNKCNLIKVPIDKVIDINNKSDWNKAKILFKANGNK